MAYPNGYIHHIETLPSPDPLLHLEMVTYESEGLAVKGYLIAPRTEGTYPGMIYCRGGINKVGMVRIERIAGLALRGFVIFAPFYRGNVGGEGREDFGGNDRYDVHNAIPVLRTNEQVNDKPISIMGFSRGSIMALFTAIECSEHIGPVIIRGGVSDLWLTYEERVDLRRMLKRVVGRTSKSPEEYDRRTPLNTIEKLRSPVLIVHGTEDEQVGVEHAYRLANALKEHGKAYELKLYEGLGHRFPPQEDNEALDYIFKWVNANLEGNDV